jgi:hypothetical protein
LSGRELALGQYFLLEVVQGVRRKQTNLALVKNSSDEVEGSQRGAREVGNDEQRTVGGARSWGADGGRG